MLFSVNSQDSSTASIAVGYEPMFSSDKQDMVHMIPPQLLMCHSRMTHQSSVFGFWCDRYDIVNVDNQCSGIHCVMVGLNLSTPVDSSMPISSTKHLW